MSSLFSIDWRSGAEVSKITRDDIFLNWMRRAEFTLLGSGQVLLGELLAWAHGRFFVDSSDADALLRRAREAGWIVRTEGRPEPSFSERVAGIGGATDWRSGADYYDHLYCFTVTDAGRAALGPKR